MTALSSVVLQGEPGPSGLGGLRGEKVRQSPAGNVSAAGTHTHTLTRVLNSGLRVLSSTLGSPVEREMKQADQYAAEWGSSRPECGSQQLIPLDVMGEES